MNTLEGLKAALALIETNGWWNGLPRECATHDANLNTMCVVTAAWHVENIDGRGVRAFAAIELQYPLWCALPEECRTGLGRTKDLIDFNDSHTEDDVKALFQRAIDACTT